MNVLVTGGVGFIGRHLVDALVDDNHEVSVLDSLALTGEPPPDLNPHARYVWGDIRDRDAVLDAAREVRAVFHLASLIDVAEGERDPGTYVDVNVRGTASLIDALTEVPSLSRLILTSSVAVYGNGVYTCADCGRVHPDPRTSEQLENAEWELTCPNCGRAVHPGATSEDEIPRPASVYGLTKLVQEKLLTAAGEALDFSVAILRYGNVYGPGQQEGGYGGVVSTFLRRARQDQPLVIHEDGEQLRDYVAVSAAVRATVLALKAPSKSPWVGNVGSGSPTPVSEIARTARELTNSESILTVDGTYRLGDLRHLYLDTDRAARDLGFQSSTSLKEGLSSLAAGDLGFPAHTPRPQQERQSD